MRTDPATRVVRKVSVVVPVYRGAATLPSLVAELAALTTPQTTPGGNTFCVDEVVLVWDRGPDASDETIRDLASQYAWVRPVWLSRNFGQHAATLAGMSSAGGDWVVTMDEDGQHDPHEIGSLLDTALTERAQLVFGIPSNPPPHSWLRNSASWTLKSFVLRFLADEVPSFSSYRLVLGEIARSIGAYAGSGVFLDVALSWVVSDIASCPVIARAEGRPATSYTYRRLASHFWRLVVSSGSKPLRMVSVLGFVCALGGVVLAVVLATLRLSNHVHVQGWTSVMVVLLLVGGAILVSLGVISEYMAAVVGSAMGRPLYLTVRDPRLPFEDAGRPGDA